jgi:hypothetical protein
VGRCHVRWCLDVVDWMKLDLVSPNGEPLWIWPRIRRPIKDSYLVHKPNNFSGFQEVSCTVQLVHGSFCMLVCVVCQRVAHIGGKLLPSSSGVKMDEAAVTVHQTKLRHITEYGTFVAIIVYFILVQCFSRNSISGFHSLSSSFESGAVIPGKLSIFSIFAVYIIIL